MTIAAVEGEVVIRLFGGVEVRGPDGSTSFGGAKQRAIVARLAIDPGHEVSVDRLIDAVWGDAAPPSVRSSLHVHVSQIRRTLAGCGLPDIVTTGPNGYVLDLPAAAIDTARFEQVAAATLSHLADGRQEHAASSLFSAISLWSGEPLPGIGAAPFAQPCATILVERRVDLLVASTDAVIARRSSG